MVSFAKNQIFCAPQIFGLATPLISQATVSRSIRCLVQQEDKLVGQSEKKVGQSDRLVGQSDFRQ